MQVAIQHYSPPYALNKLVGFQTSKELHSDDYMKDSDDSKEQSTEDFKEVNDTNDTCCCKSLAFNYQTTLLTMSVPKR